MGVEISNRGNLFRIKGDLKTISAVERLLQSLYARAAEGTLSLEKLHLQMHQERLQQATHTEPQAEQSGLKIGRRLIHGKNTNQRGYMRNILAHDINFCIGPAGTGKTYLAVACAVAALEQECVRRIVLVRPAVEAGENLGFLPGNLLQKIDPYLRPLYDALYEILGFERVSKYIESHIIEIAPLAFMRGRTLNESFIILDEAQNATAEQMKMFLTRIGFGATAVIAGDITQVDLPDSKGSGLKQAVEILKDQEGISLTLFDTADVVRHPLVEKILNAYDSYQGNGG